MKIEKGKGVMATTAPSRPAEVIERIAGSKRLVESLHPWRQRLWMQQALRWAGNGIIAGLVLACILLLFSRFIPWATASYWAIMVATASLLCALGASLWYRPSFGRTAHLVDVRLALHDRLSTAWELRDKSAPLPELQRRDALKQLGRHKPATVISLWPRRAGLIAFGVVIIALALLVFLPNPMTVVLQQQAAFQARIARQVAAINHIRTVIDNQTTTSAQERSQIDKILREAAAQLQQAKNQAQAQQILAQAQAKLNQLRDPQAANKAMARTAASSSLQSSSNPNLSTAGQALAKGDNKGLDAALQKLASQVKNMTAAQRAQLAQQIEQAANQARQNPQLSSALHQLAKAVADGSPSDVSDAINAVENAATQDTANQENNNSIDQASQTLQNTATALASATDNTSGQNQAQNQGQGQNQNQGQGQGQGQNQGQGQIPGQGQSPGQGQGQNQGQGQGQNQGQNQGQGNNGTGGQTGTGNKQGKNDQVYVPGQVTSGTSTITNNGNNGIVQPGRPVPYSKVIAQYQQMAHDDIDSSNIPPDLKDLIQEYYNSLEGQQ